MDKFKNVMITGTITTAREESLKVYEVLVKELSSKGVNKIYSPLDTIQFKGSNEEMYARVMNLLKETDLVIAEMSSPSTGQGMELQEAVRLNIPIMIVAKKGSKISSTVLGSGMVKNVFFYDSKEEIKNNFFNIIERI